MSWLSRLLGGRSEPKPVKMDYVAEARALERAGDLDGALTSYRLALREAPGNVAVLQDMAIVYTRTSRPEEAMRCYRRALDVDPHLAGAHYGLAFLLLKRNEASAAAEHLRAFIANAPADAAAESHLTHARETLQALEAEGLA